MSHPIESLTIDADYFAELHDRICALEGEGWITHQLVVWPPGSEHSSCYFAVMHRYPEATA